jgi:hypothetical protein
MSSITSFMGRNPVSLNVLRFVNDWAWITVYEEIGQRTCERVRVGQVLDAANMDEAVAWGRIAVVACRASVEEREFLAIPTE